MKYWMNSWVYLFILLSGLINFFISSIYWRNNSIIKINRADRNEWIRGFQSGVFLGVIGLFGMYQLYAWPNMGFLMKLKLPVIFLFFLYGIFLIFRARKALQEKWADERVLAIYFGKGVLFQGYLAILIAIISLLFYLLL